MSKVSPSDGAKSLKDVPEIPKGFEPLNFGMSVWIAAIFTFFRAMRAKIDRFALTIQTYRPFMKSGNVYGPTIIRTGKTAVIMCGKPATDLLKSDATEMVEKPNKVFPFNKQHAPHLKQHGNSVMFTAIKKADWDFHVSRHPFKDPVFMADWMKGLIQPMSKNITSRIARYAKESADEVDARDFNQRILFNAWRFAQLGPDFEHVAEGFLNYDGFMIGANAVNSAVGSMCCPYLSSLGIYGCTAKGAHQFDMEARAVDSWISKYKSDPTFKAARTFTELGKMCDSPKYSVFIDSKKPWGEADNKGSFGLEVAVAFVSDLYGGVFSGASIICTALKGLESLPEELMKLRFELTSCGASSVETVSLENLQNCAQLKRVVCEAFRFRHAVPILSRVVVKEGLVVENVSLPKGTAVTVSPRSDMYDPMWGDDPEVYRPSRWTDELLTLVGNNWEQGVPGFIPFGTGPRRCNGRELAFPTILAAVARYAMECQFFFNKPIDPTYKDETWFYGTAGYTNIDMNLLNADHPKQVKMHDITPLQLSEQGIGMGVYAGVMGLLFRHKPGNLTINPAETDFKEFGPPPTVIVKAHNTTFPLADEYKPDKKLEDFMENMFGTLNESNFDEDVGPSFPSQQDELEWVKKAYPDILSNNELMGGLSYWPGGSSDVGTSRLFTHGLGATLLVHKGTYLEVDLTALNGYATRNGIEPVGCHAKFTLEGNLTSISKMGVTFTPADGQGWEKAKLNLRSSVLVYITIRDHLCWVHFRCSNSTVYCQRKTLTKDHPLSRFLQPYVFNAVAINLKANLSLVPKGSLAHRLSGLSGDVYHTAFSDIYESWIFESFPDSLKRRGMDRLSPDVYPFATEGLRFWETVNTFVTQFVALYYPTDASIAQDDCARNFVNEMNTAWGVGADIRSKPATVSHLVLLLTMHIFWVTGMHNQVGGQLAILMQTPFLLPPAMRTWDKMDKKSSWHKLLPPQKLVMTTWTLVGMTQGVQPMIYDDYSHLFVGLPNEQEAVKLIKDFTGPVLKSLGEEMEARNANRQWALRMFHPNFLLSSVSV